MTEHARTKEGESLSNWVPLLAAFKSNTYSISVDTKAAFNQNARNLGRWTQCLPKPSLKFLLLEGTGKQSQFITEMRGQSCHHPPLHRLVCKLVDSSLSSLKFCLN